MVTQNTSCRKLTLNCVSFVRVRSVSYVFTLFLSLRVHLEVARPTVGVLYLAAVKYTRACR